MTQAVNLANFSNNLDTSGGVNPSALNAAVPVSKGGTGDVTAAGARINLGLVIGTNVPSPTGTGASGTWPISISGNAATASNGGVTSVNGLTGAVTISGGVSSVVAGNGISVSASTGAVTIASAADGYNTVGSYVSGAQYRQSIGAITSGSTYSAGNGNGLVYAASPQGQSYNLSGTWRWMGPTINVDGCNYAFGYSVMVRVS